MKREILNFSNKISKNFSKLERKFTADVTYGMLASESCLLTDIVDRLHENVKKANPPTSPKRDSRQTTLLRYLI